jgi:hypothetical protein
VANDPKSLSPAPIKTPFYNASGNVSDAWNLWFQKLVQRVGGPYSDPVSQIITNLDALTTRVGVVETNVTGLQGNVATINAQITTIVGDLALLDTRVSAIENALAAGFTGTITTAQLTLAGTQGSMTFVNGILTSQVQAT